MNNMMKNIELEALKVWRGIHPRARFSELCNYSRRLAGEIADVRRGSGLLGRMHLLLSDGRACPCYHRTNE